MFLDTARPLSARDSSDSDSPNGSSDFIDDEETTSEPEPESVERHASSVTYGPVTVT